MTKKDLAEALEEIRKQPEIAERMKQESVNSPQDVPAFWAEVLAEKGYNVSSEEIAAFIQEAEGERRKKTQEHAGKIELLSDQDLEEVAGGGDHPECESSYKDKENCWLSDACDYYINFYSGYICEHKWG